jgi:hypothetical protein
MWVMTVTWSHYFVLAIIATHTIYFATTVYDNSTTRDRTAPHDGNYYSIPS